MLKKKKEQLDMGSSNSALRIQFRPCTSRNRYVWPRETKVRFTKDLIQKDLKYCQFKNAGVTLGGQREGSQLNAELF